MGHRFLAHLLAALLLLTALVATIGRRVDPFGAWAPATAADGSRPRTAEHSRLRLAYGLRRQPPATLLLGSSRVRSGFVPDDPWIRERLGPASVAGYAGCTMIEAAAHAAHVRAPRVVVGLDLGMFLVGKPTQDAFSSERLRQVAAGGVPGLLWRVRDTLFSRHALRAALAEMRDPPPEPLRPGLGRRPDLRRRITRTMAVWSGVAARDGDTYALQLAALEGMLHDAGSARRSVRLFLSPHHVWFHEATAQARLWSWAERWRRDVAGAVFAARARGTDVTLWEFSAPHELTTERVRTEDAPDDMVHFKDGSHYTPAIGRRMLQRMTGDRPDDDFGWPLDPPTFESRQEELRRRLAGWAADHPDDVAWLAAALPR